MSTPLSYTIVAGGNNTTPSSFTLAIPTTTVAPLQIGHNQLIRVVSDQPVFIRFGGATTATATNQDVYLPANVVEVFDMGRANENVVVYNAGTTTANVNLTIVSRT